MAAALLAALWPAAAGPQAPPGAEPNDPTLVEGVPPLKQSDVEAWKHLVELAFGDALTKEQSALLQDQLVAHWGQANGSTRSQLGQASAAWQQIGTAQGAHREMLRLALREQLLEAARSDPDDAISKLVLGLYDAASPVLVDGEPPLRKGSVGALISLLEWLTSQAAGQAVELNEVERDRFTSQLVEYYPHAAPGDRMLLAHLEETLAFVRAQWAEADPQGQANFRANLARLMGLNRPPLPAPYAGPTETWEHPNGLFSVDYPAEWPARYGSLSDGTIVAGWSLFDVTVLGEAPSAALELGALPDAGALIAAAAVPPDVLADRLTIEEAAFALAHELLSPSGAAEPLGDTVVGKGAVLAVWRQQSAGAEYFVWLSVLLLREPRGGAIATLARAPSAQKADLEPAFSHIVYSLRLPDPDAKQLPELLDFPDPRDLALDLLNTPLREQMDMIEGLTSGMR